MEAAPASKHVFGRFDLQKESTQVASQTKNWPWDQGVMESPSGCDLSLLLLLLLLLLCVIYVSALFYISYYSFLITLCI